MSTAPRSKISNMHSHFERSKWLIILALTVLLTTIYIQYLLTHYRLLNFPGYDDVAYFKDSATWVEIFFRKGFLGLLKNYYHVPPHSVISVLQGFVGYLLFGYQTWAPYVTNGVIVFLLLWFADRWVKRLDWWLRIGVYLFVCTIPFLVLAVCEFRPDFFWGLIVAFGTLYPLAESWLYRSRYYQVLWGILLGLALLIKPSTFPATLFFFGCAWLLSLVFVRIDNMMQYKTVKQYTVATFYLLGTALLVAIPYYIIAFHDVFGYIYQALVSNKEVWAVKTSLSKTLGYYFSGPGRIAIYNHKWLLLLLAFTSLVVATVNKDNKYLKKLSVLALMVLILYAVPTYVTLKNPFLGSGFICGLIFIGLFALNYILDRFHSRIITNIVIMLLIILTGMMIFHWPHSRGTKISPRIVHTNQLFNHVYEDIIHHVADQSILVAATIDGPLVSDAFQLKARMDGYFDVTFASWSFLKKSEQALSDFYNADFVLAQEQGTEGVSENLPSANIQQELLNMLYHSSQFHMINSYRSFNGKKLVLFEKIRNFYGLKSLWGIDYTLENSYKTHKSNKKVRWGKDNMSEFEFLDQGAISGTLTLSLKPLFAEIKSVTIFIDDHLIKTVVFKNTSSFTTIRMNIDLKSNIKQHTLLLRYNRAANIAPSYKKGTNIVEFSQVQFVIAQTTPTPVIPDKRRSQIF